MGQKINVGDKRNQLILLERIHKNGYTMFRCKCLDCESETVIHSNNFGRAKNCGCSRGFAVGSTTKLGVKIIEHIYVGNRLKHFRCLCKCGTEFTIGYTMIFRQRSCGCLRQRKGKDHPLFKGHEGIYGSKWSTYIDNAKKRNIPFDLTIKDAWNIYEKQTGKCALTGLPLTLWPSAKNDERRASASLDRINNKKGYTKDNVWWVHKDINQIKMDMPTQQFIDLCKKVVEHENRK